MSLSADDEYTLRLELQRALKFTEQLLGYLVEADKLAEAVSDVLGRFVYGGLPTTWPEAKHLRAALDAYKIVRNGQ